MRRELRGVAVGEAAGLAHPAAGIDGASDDERVEPGDLRDVLDRKDERVQPPFTDDPADLLGDPAGRSVLARCGDEHTHFVPPFVHLHDAPGRSGPHRYRHGIRHAADYEPETRLGG